MTASERVAAVSKVRSTPWPARGVAHERLEAVHVAGASIQAERQGAGNPLRVQIEPDHPAPVRPQQLHRDLANQSEPDDRHALAERRRGAADPLERDGPDRGERRRPGLHSGRRSRNEVGGHRHDLCVAGAAGARARDELARPEVRDATGVDHKAGARVAKRHVGSSDAPGKVKRVAQTVLAHVLECLAYQIRVADGAHRQRPAASA